ncbi:Ig-like domain-containing protein [Pontibacillus yanchengensis]|uniref:SbsA Ig-like domain-containing protein n=1 Tax=Pontibacillus yanchengensis Y32 TaxID=1385514 RepID=A0A0A2TKR4_9BACI|nr:Ig-like domain-containing protein [Pontibacillus yanchengensis]KGP74666.1 hypothetical protein N782_00225 [Pontibacillus yanchengensis Y32]
MKRTLFLLTILFFISLLLPNISEAEVGKQKKWTIQFNTTLDEETINEESIRVTNLDGEEMNVNTTIVDGNSVVVEAPPSGYTPGESYLLHISSDIKSTDGYKLKNAVVMDFTVQTSTIPSKEVISSQTTSHNIQNLINPYNPIVDISKLGIDTGNIDLMGISKNDSNLNKRIYTDDENLLVDTNEELNPLQLNTSYMLKIYMEDGHRHYVHFNTSGLPTLPTESDDSEVVMIPAMPDQGFNYPYFLRMPPDYNKDKHIDSSRYLMVLPNNTGSSNDYEKTLEDTRRQVQRHPLSQDLGNTLWSPVLMPAFPRPRLNYEDGYFYTHALDRYTVTLSEQKYQEVMKDDRFLSQMKQEGYTRDDIHDMVDVEGQLEAMIDHATQYLNEYDQNIVEEKVFLTGYSAGGNFTNRWAALYPERVKAVASGGVNSTAIIPSKQAKGEDLIYPIGISDYKDITGHSFNMEAYNQVANFIYQGETDENDTYGYSDTFGPEEERLIQEVLGEEMYPTRWNNNKNLYFESGAKGAFGLYKGVGHEISDNIIEDLVEFYKANRDSKNPVYPSSSSNLEVDTGEE